MPAGHDRIGFHFLQYRRDASAIGIHLNRRPRIGFRSSREPRVLSLDPNEIRVAAREALPPVPAWLHRPAATTYIVPSRPKQSWARGPGRSDRPLVTIPRLGILPLSGPAV
jgi:hypothetical protein